VRSSLILLPLARDSESDVLSKLVFPEAGDISRLSSRMPSDSDDQYEYQEVETAEEGDMYIDLDVPFSKKVDVCDFRTPIPLNQGLPGRTVGSTPKHRTKSLSSLAEGDV
jgi:hypothetical protein